jgi:hypothetical protein
MPTSTHKCISHIWWIVGVSTQYQPWHTSSCQYLVCMSCVWAVYELFFCIYTLYEAADRRSDPPVPLAASAFPPDWCSADIAIKPSIHQHSRDTTKRDRSITERNVSLSKTLIELNPGWNSQPRQNYRERSYHLRRCELKNTNCLSAVRAYLQVVTPLRIETRRIGWIVRLMFSQKVCIWLNNGK